LTSALTANALSGFLGSKSSSTISAEWPFTDDDHPASRYMLNTAPASCDACRKEYMPGMGIARDRCDCMAFTASSPSDETMHTTNHNGDGYVGTQTHTRSGKNCEKWDNPGTADVTGITVTAEMAAHNECRNPNGRDSIWCFTMTTLQGWEYCDPAPGSFRPMQYSYTCSTRPSATDWVSHRGGCKCQYGATAEQTSCLDIPVQSVNMDPQDPRLNLPLTDAATALNCAGFTCATTDPVSWNRPMASTIGCADSSGCTQSECCTALSALP